MKTKQKLLAFLTSAMMLTATACSNAPVISKTNKQVTVNFSWWGNDGRNRYTLEAIEKFEELHPEVKVECSYSEWSGFETRNKVQMISDTEADVMQINFGWLDTYSKDGEGYYDINELTDQFALENFSDQVLSYGIKADHLNAIPIAMNTETVYINKTIYDKYGLEVPKTWDDFFAAAKVMQPDGIYPISCASKPMWLVLIAYAEQAQHKTFLRENGDLNFNAKDFQVMIEFYQRLTAEGVLPQVEQYERLKLDNEEYAGAVAWVSDGNNYFKDAVENGRQIVCADYTTIDGKNVGEGWYAKPATMYAVSRNTEHPKEAAMLLDFLLNSPEMASLQGIEKGIPLSASAKATIEQEGMLTGVQYEASQKMEGVKLGQLNAILENSSLIDDFFAAANDVIYAVAPVADRSGALYQKVKTDYFS